MLVLSTLCKTTIWGGTRLQPFGADADNPSVGSLYTVAGNEDMTCTVLNGQFAGQTLYQVYRDHRELFGYDKYEPFPLLIGLVDASDDLSIQLHPSDEYAKQHENAPFGKTESWIFLEAPASGAIVNGCKCASLSELEEKIEKGKWNEVYDHLPVQQNDYVFVETGTLHALCAGSLVYEIQQSTDVTYRFYDYDRVGKDGKKRPLQLEKALENVNVAGKSASVPCEMGKVFTHPYYSVQRNAFSGSFTNERDTFATFTLLSGEMRADGLTVSPGTSLILFPHETVTFGGAVNAVVAYPQ